MRKEVCLYFLRDGKLALQALFFALLGKEALQRVGHAVEGAAQGCELVVARDLDAMREIALVDFYDIYNATVEIDQGNLAHRIKITRNDQLAALSRSFNRMSYSLERLLAEQREKERLQSELAIAQEVQANLFPHGSVSLPMLELHGACYPARTVSGDYYDFLVTGDSGLGLALGDISGKGISAALLMATLHSAVRAYRFAGEDLLTSRNGEENDDPFLEPAKILTQLNRHLYRSTQPEKYATLFLAHYDGTNQQLTYSCGGQLPPLVLRADDTVATLGCGGT